jgi:hypothetical protein
LSEGTNSHATDAAPAYASALAPHRDVAATDHAVASAVASACADADAPHSTVTVNVHAGATAYASQRDVTVSVIATPAAAHRNAPLLSP